MRAKEDCSWCMSTQHIERKIGDGMPEEYKFRCSACHEMWGEENRLCDYCEETMINIEEDEYFYNPQKHTFRCLDCKARLKKPQVGRDYDVDED